MTRNIEAEQSPLPTPELPLAAPPWAVHSVPEPDRVTHETVSGVHPPVRWCGSGGWLEAPADISLSVIDLPTGRGWRRQPATVQVEGGSYSLFAARQLCDVLNGLLASAAGPDPGAQG
jgi:hypothetical protein